MSYADGIPRVSRVFSFHVQLSTFSYAGAYGGTKILNPSWREILSPYDDEVLDTATRMTLLSDILGLSGV